MKESSIVREGFHACAHHKIQVIESRYFARVAGRVLPPPYPFDGNNGVCWRNNTGFLENGKRGIRFGIPGAPDIMGVLRGGRIFGLEAKTDSGGLSNIQRWYHSYFGQMGMLLAVYRSYGEACAVLDEWIA